MRRVFGVIRLGIAALGVVGLVGDYLYTLGFRAFQIENFFAYFTTQSNVAAVIVLALSGLVALAGRPDPRWISTTRALVITYIVVSGIVFALIAAESNSRGIRLDVPWSSAVLHFWIPSLTILEWVLGPGRRPVPWRTTAIVLGFPLVWAAITIVRGAIVGWYPYFFLDPSQVSWPWEYLMYDAIVVALISGIAAFVAALSRIRPPAEQWEQRRRARSA